MVLLWETAEDVTWRNRGHKGGIRHEEDKKIGGKGPVRKLDLQVLIGENVCV